MRARATSMTRRRPAKTKRNWRSGGPYSKWFLFNDWTCSLWTWARLSEYKLYRTYLLQNVTRFSLLLHATQTRTTTWTTQPPDSNQDARKVNLPFSSRSLQRVWRSCLPGCFSWKRWLQATGDWREQAHAAHFRWYLRQALKRFHEQNCKEIADWHLQGFFCRTLRFAKLSHVLSNSRRLGTRDHCGFCPHGFVVYNCQHSPKSTSHLSRGLFSCGIKMQHALWKPSWRWQGERGCGAHNATLKVCNTPQYPQRSSPGWPAT